MAESLVALGIAFAHGARHASDPDHLVAVTSLVTAEGGDTRRAARLGAWWGAGHAAILLAVGLPLILLDTELPAWLESGAEQAVGVVIVLLAARVLLKWLRPRDGRTDVRGPAQAFSIGLLHGLAGTGAVVVLLIATLPTQVEAAAALAVFAPASLASMALCTSVFAWALTQRRIEPVVRPLLIPALGLFGLVFGLWYAGVA